MADNQKIREEVQALTDKLESGIQDLYSSDKYASYLDTLAKFHNYSTRNTLLIHLQMPNATNVAGFNKWKNDFERHVMKGEKGIRIFAPAPFTMKKEMEKLDPETQVPLLDNEGNAVTEEVEITIPSFKPVSVFDVLQTDGKPLPSVVENLTGDVRQYEAFLDSLKAVSTMPIGFGDMAESQDGMCDVEARTITIRNGMSEVQTISAVVHEMTHAELHDYNKQLDLQELANTPDISDDAEVSAQKPRSRRAEEVEAESVSYVVCQHYNIETGANSFGYIANWSNGRELDELKASLNIIRKTAASMIERIDGKFAEICKDRGIDLSAEQEHSEPVQSLESADLSPTQEQDTPTVTESEENNQPQNFESSTRPTELQQKGIEIAKRYENLPLQNKINIIAETFGCKTATISTSPCTGKWRGTSDISLDLDNGASLFIGNYRTPQAKTAKVQNECINSTLAQYNPEMVTETKARATAALILREAEDNAIAAGKGLKPYTFLNVELNDGSADRTGGYLGWYYVTLAVENKIFAFVETGLEHDIHRGVVGGKPNERAYFVAGALKESDVDFVFNNVAFSSESRLYHLDLSDSARERAENRLAELITAVDNATQQEEIEHEYHIGCGPYENGVAVWDWNDQTDENGDEKHLAYINSDKAITHFNNNLPENIKGEIELIANGNWKEMFAIEMAGMDYLTENSKEADIIMPDPHIDVSERDLYGYTYTEMYPMLTERALELFDQDQTIYLLYPDGTEAIAFDREEIENFDGIFGIESEEWRELQEYEQMKAGVQFGVPSQEAGSVYGKDATYAIYQLKDGDETRNYRFEALDRLEARGLSVDKDNYNLVYSAPLTDSDTLDKLYEKFNIERPDDFKGHSLSMSDIVVMTHDGETTAHYIDRIGFAELSDFFKEKAQQENPLPEVQQREKDQNTNIDVSPTSQPTLAELETQVKSGQQISILDLAQAVKSEQIQKEADKPRTGRTLEKKPSILAQLQTAKKDIAQGQNQPKNTPKRNSDREV